MYRTTKLADVEFGHLLESIPDGVVLADAVGCIVLTNTHAEKLFGYAPGELRGRPIEALIPTRLRTRHVAHYSNYFAQPHTRHIDAGLELYGLRKDGSEFSIEISLNPLQVDGGTLVFAVVRDISERKRIAAALQEKNVELEIAARAKSTFLATMSHEIRTPLNGILGMLELLSLTPLDEGQRASVDVVRQSGRMLMCIIDDILDYSKIEAGKLAIHNEVASVEAVVRNTCSLYSGLASSKGLSLTKVIDDRISPAVWVDPQRLQQILGNLVGNAIKFTATGYVEIRADLVEKSADGNVIDFTVADTGIGIAPSDQQRLFEPFTQVDGNTTRPFGGTGLGLSICRKLADLMGGAIQMESVPNVGTNIHLVLRLSVADPAELPDRKRTEGRPERIKMRPAPSVERALADGTLVLVIDDHEVNRLVLKQQVTTLGYAVETAEDGLEGLEKWQSGRYGIVLVDCHMPVLDGYEMARRIRAIESGTGRKRTPVVACTANALSDDREKCIAAGMDDYLAKPLELRELALKLAKWLPVRGLGEREAV